MAIRFSNGFIMGSGGPPPSSLTFFTDLGVITSYLKNYMSDFQNPDFNFYSLDGNGFFIQDGEGDMYDDGNATTPWLISNQTYTGGTSYSINNYPHAVNYQTTVNPGTEDTSFGYLSLGYNSPNYLPLTVIGTRATIASPGAPIGFQTGGNSGADGSGSHIEGNIYTGNTVSGFTVHAYYSETYDAGDPSTCSVFILLGHPNWNSVFGDVYYGGDSDTNTNGAFLYTSGGGTQNILAIKTLLSKPNGTEVTFSEVNTVVDNFIIRIGESQAPTSTPTPTPTPTPTYHYYYLLNCNLGDNKYGRSTNPSLNGNTFNISGNTCYSVVGIDLGTYYDYDLDIATLVTDCTDVSCAGPTPTPSATSSVTPTPTLTPSSTMGATPTPTPTPSTGAGAGVGSWYFYSSDEGAINVGPPTANGNTIFTINSGSPVETFNPNKASGVTFLYFNVRDSVGTNYTSQFSGYTGGTGTITISQNGDTATYTSTTPGSFFIETNLGGSPYFMIAANACTQTKSSNASFVYGDPISITFGS